MARATVLVLGALLALPAAQAVAEPVRIQIQNPGKTGLSPGLYLVDVEPGPSSATQVRVVVYATPSDSRHRYLARKAGCGEADLAAMAWSGSVAIRPDGSLRLQLASTSERGCQLVATIPASKPSGSGGAPPVPDTEGVPEEPPQEGIEGSPIGTVGVVDKGLAARGRKTGPADREMQQLIAKAREALPLMACPTATEQARLLLGPVLTALRQLGAASSPAAAVQPHRRFEAAKTDLQKKMAADPAWREGAARCVTAERTCAASGPVGAGCGIDAAVCLANVICSTPK